LSYSTSPSCEGFCQDRISQNDFPLLTLNHDPPDLCLLRS
jgi:hypothetical protein